MCFIDYLIIGPTKNPIAFPYFLASLVTSWMMPLPNSVKRSDRTDPIIGYLLRETFIRCEYGKYRSLPWWTRWKLSGLPQVPQANYDHQEDHGDEEQRHIDILHRFLILKVISTLEHISLDHVYNVDKKVLNVLNTFRHLKSLTLTRVMVYKKQLI